MGAYATVLEVSEDSVLLLSRLLQPSVSSEVPARDGVRWEPYKQAVLLLRWFLEDTRMSALARDNAIFLSTAYA